MDTRRLRYFLAIVDAGSISRAAAEIGVAQPALSQQLAVLEGELKAKLLDRSSTGVTLTPAGQAVAGQARALLRHLEDLRASARAGPDQLAGVVSLGVSPTLNFDFGVELTTRVLARHPQVRLRILEAPSAGLREGLARGDYDLALAGNQARGTERTEVLFKEQLFLICAPHLRPAAADMAGIAGLPWIVTTSPNAMRSWLDARFTEHGAEPRIVAESNSLSFVVSAAEQGLGATVLSLGAVREALAAGRLVAVPFSPQPFWRTIRLADRPAISATPAAGAVRDILRDLVRERFPEG